MESMLAVVHDNLEKAQDIQKYLYDRDACQSL